MGLGIRDVIGDKRDQILTLAQKRGASNVRVFGSVARGQAGPESDLDLLVDFAPDYRLLDHTGLTVELSALLARKVDVAVSANLRDDYRSFILNEARPL